MLHIDHVNGDGDLYRDRAHGRERSRRKIYQEILSDETDGKYAVLCANCHQFKTLRDYDYLPSKANGETADLVQLDLSQQELFSLRKS